MSYIQTLQAINNIDDDILDELLASLNTSEVPKETQKKKLIKLENAIYLFAAVFAILTLAVAAASSLLPTGWWISANPFSDETLLLLENYMSKNAGLIAEDEYIRVEAAGSLRDGNTAMMGILVTLKQLDSAVIEGSIFPIPGYFFEYWNLGTLGKDGSFGCLYSNDLPYLQENQFLFQYTCTADEPLPDEITMELSGIGYIAGNGSFTLYREGTWEWTFHYDDMEKEGLQEEISERIKVGQNKYIVELAEVSMFGIELALKPKDSSVFGMEDESFAARNSMLKDLMAAFSDIRIRCQDGTEMVLAASSGGTVANEAGTDLDGTFRISVPFIQPIPTEQIQSITMLDGQIKFTN